MSPNDLPLVWLDATPTSPPLSREARLQCGYLLRRLQRGDRLQMPLSRPMPAIGRRCHELRVRDNRVDWRLVYRLDEDAIVVVAVFEKRTQKTPRAVLDLCRARLQKLDSAEKRKDR